MITQVGAAYLPAQRREGQHLVPLDARLGEAPAEVPMPRDRAHAVVVNQEAHRDPAPRGAREGLVEGSRVLVPRGLVVQGVDVVGSAVDAGGHRTEGLCRVVVEAGDAAAGGREAAELTRHAHEGAGRALDAGRRLVGLGFGGNRGGEDAIDEGAGLGIVVEATPHRPPRAEHDVEGNAHEGHQEDEEQPRRRRGGAPVLRHDTEGDDADGKLDGPEEEPRPQRRFGGWRKHVSMVQSAPGPGPPSAASAARRSRRPGPVPGGGARPRRGRPARSSGPRPPRRRRSPR